MKQCPKCGNTHSKKGTYCSRTCANTRVHSEETKEKLRNKMQGRYTRKTKASAEENRQRAEKVRQTCLEKYLNTPFELLGMMNRKRRVLEEQNGKCNNCGIDTWLGNPIVLELEHKDGNTKNNARENLECLCPNCHSLTSTWRGRNNKKEQVTDLELLSALQLHSKISEALRSVGLTDKGSNYERAKKLLGQ